MYGFENVVAAGGQLAPESVEQYKIIASMLDNIGTDSRGSYETQLKAGLCLGWSAEWIIHNSSSLSFWAYLNTTSGRADLMNMARREHQSKDTNTLLNIANVQSQLLQDRDLQAEVKKANEARKNWARVLIESHGKLKAGARVEPNTGQGTDKNGFARKIVQTPGYKLITLILDPLKGNHAVAASVTSDGVIYMDPNGGEASFPKHHLFTAWFALQHLPCYDPDGFRSYSIEPYPCPVNETAQREEIVIPQFKPKSRNRQGMNLGSPNAVPQGAQANQGVPRRPGLTRAQPVREYDTADGGGTNY